MSRSLRQNFDVLSSAIALNKIDLDCAETVKSKPTGNGSGFITYSKKINVYGIWLDKIGYLITQWQHFVKEQAVTWFKKLGISKKLIEVGINCDKDDTLIVEEKRLSLISNMTKIIFEMTPRQR